MHTDGFKPLLSIIIPVLNEPIKTIRCMASIRANTIIPHEIIWVDNGSLPDNFDMVKRQATKPRVHTKVIKFKENKGFVQAVNAGLTEIEDSSKFVILLNNDTEVTKKWDTRLTSPLKDESVGAVGPLTQSLISWQEPSHVNLRWKVGLPPFPRGREATRALIDYANKLEALPSRDKYIEVGDIPLSFFCAAFRKDIFEKLGPLDEDFGLGLGDDDEYCFRMRLHKYKMLLSLGAFVFHWHRTTFSSLKVPIDQLRRRNVAKLKLKKQQLTEAYANSNP